MKQLAPKANLGNIDSKTLELTKYPNQVLNYNLENPVSGVFQITPAAGRNIVDEIAIWVMGRTYEGMPTATMNLGATGLNGIVDGITFVAANARQFLIWGFANSANTEWLGFGMTHKPYSSCTPPTVNQGASTTISGITNAYQFTEGARIVVRNDNGSSPDYEWNWATITSISSSTQLAVTMDNGGSLYGSNLTAGATNADVLQWDKFRPWVVSSTGQVLYSESYRLLGELETSNTGYVDILYRVDDPWRSQNTLALVTTTTPNITTLYASCGRYMPLWATMGNFEITTRSTAANDWFYIARAGINVNAPAIFLRTQALNTYIDAKGIIRLGPYCRVAYIASTVNVNYERIREQGYYVPNGMRL